MKCYLLILFLGMNCCVFAMKSLGDGQYFKTTQSATTASVISARQKALLFAKNTLATMVNGKVENVTKSYIEHNSETGKSADDFMTETRMTANMLLQNVTVTDENVIKEKNGKYTVYITLKLRTDDVLKALCKKLSASKQDKETFHKEVFVDLWERENK